MQVSVTDYKRVIVAAKGQGLAAESDLSARYSRTIGYPVIQD